LVATVETNSRQATQIVLSTGDLRLLQAVLLFDGGGRLSDEFDEDVLEARALDFEFAEGQGGGGGDPEEVPRMRRRIEQLQAELRLYRGGGEGAQRFEQLEEEIARVAEERDRLKMRVGELEATLRAEGGDAKVQRAGAIAQTAAEIVSGLNDVLSNLRINVMAAEGEFDQYASAIPRASFELIREALRSSAVDMETARELLRKLRALAM